MHPRKSFFDHIGDLNALSSIKIENDLWVIFSQNQKVLNSYKKCYCTGKFFRVLVLRPFSKIFFAKVFTQNVVMASVIAAQIVLEERTAHRENRYKVNISHSISKMKHVLVRFSVKFDVMLFEKYIAILSLTAEAIRLGRSFRRHKKMRGSNCIFQNMKPVC